RGGWTAGASGRSVALAFWSSTETGVSVTAVTAGADGAGAADAAIAAPSWRMPSMIVLTALTAPGMAVIQTAGATGATALGRSADGTWPTASAPDSGGGSRVP